MMFVFEGVTPYIYGIFTGAFFAYIFANLAGNRKVPTADAAQKEAALALKPPPGKALLVVYREGFVAKLAGLNIAVDGQEFAQLTAPKFTVLTLPAGAHTLTCGFGGLAGPQSKPGSYEFDVARGRCRGGRHRRQDGRRPGQRALQPDRPARRGRPRQGRPHADGAGEPGADLSAASDRASQTAIGALMDLCGW